MMDNHPSLNLKARQKSSIIIVFYHIYLVTLKSSQIMFRDIQGFMKWLGVGDQLSLISLH